MRKDRTVKFKNLTKLLGLQVRNLRLSKNWTIDDLASHSKIRKQYIERIERGEAIRLKLSHLEALSDSFKIEISELLSFDQTSQ